MCVFFVCMLWTDKMLCVVGSFIHCIVPCMYVACSMQALLTNQGQKMEEAPIISREEVSQPISSVLLPCITGPVPPHPVQVVEAAVYLCGILSREFIYTEVGG